MIDKPAPEFLWTLFTQLRRRHFPLSPDDYEAMRQALRAGFGWSSRDALRELCSVLWAKSKDEQEIVATLFDQFRLDSWELPALESSFVSSQHIRPEKQGQPPRPSESHEPIVTTEAKGELLPIFLDEEELPESHFVLVPQFPLTYREVAQAWRWMRQPGPNVRSCDLGSYNDKPLDFRGKTGNAFHQLITYPSLCSEKHPHDKFNYPIRFGTSIPEICS